MTDYQKGRETVPDDREWLIKSQQLLTNVRGWLSNGLSETAMRAIDDYWREWPNRGDHAVD